MKRRSLLETLKELRERARDGEKLRLATKIREEAAAVAEAERARQVLAAARSEVRAERNAESQRLREGVLTAAEGQRRMVWESGERRRDAMLAAELERAVESQRGAALEHERAALDLGRADAAVGQVEGRLERAETLRQRALEAAQQEVLDEATLRRFVEQSRS